MSLRLWPVPGISQEYEYFLPPGSIVPADVLKTHKENDIVEKTIIVETFS